MHLNLEIDQIIQSELVKEGLEYKQDTRGKLFIAEYRMDKKAQIGMLYLKKPAEVPEGKLDFKVLEVPYLYGVFYENRSALILEIGSRALDGEIIDYYSSTAYLNRLKRRKNS